MAGTTVANTVCIFLNRVLGSPAARDVRWTSRPTRSTRATSTGSERVLVGADQVDEHRDGEDRTVLVLRRWRNGDWGEDSTPAWWCTGAEEATASDRYWRR